MRSATGEAMGGAIFVMVVVIVIVVVILFPFFNKACVKHTLISYDTDMTARLMMYMQNGGYKMKEDEEGPGVYYITKEDAQTIATLSDLIWLPCEQLSVRSLVEGIDGGNVAAFSDCTQTGEINVDLHTRGLDDDGAYYYDALKSYIVLKIGTHGRKVVTTVESIRNARTSIAKTYNEEDKYLIEQEVSSCLPLTASDIVWTLATVSNRNRESAYVCDNKDRNEKVLVLFKYKDEKDNFQALVRAELGHDPVSAFEITVQDTLELMKRYSTLRNGPISACIPVDYDKGIMEPANQLKKINDDRCERDVRFLDVDNPEAPFKINNILPVVMDKNLIAKNHAFKDSQIRNVYDFKHKRLSQTAVERMRTLGFEIPKDQSCERFFDYKEYANIIRKEVEGKKFTKKDNTCQTGGAKFTRYYVLVNNDHELKRFLNILTIHGVMDVSYEKGGLHLTKIQLDLLVTAGLDLGSCLPFVLASQVVKEHDKIAAAADKVSTSG